MKFKFVTLVLFSCITIPQFTAAQSDNSGSRDTNDAAVDTDDKAAPPAPEDDTDVDEVFSEEDVADTIEEPASEEEKAAEDEKTSENENATAAEEAPEVEKNPYGMGEKEKKTAAAPVPKEKDNPPWVEAPPEETLEPEEESTTYLPPPPPPPPLSEALPGEPSETSETRKSPCDAVSCSGRGACVIKGGEPTCACRPGFVPDSVNGLSCIPESNRPRRPQATWDMETYYDNLRQAMLPYDISPKLADYRAQSSRNERPGSFSDYLRGSFKRTKNLATVELSFGIAGLAGGLSMHMMYAGFPDRGGFLAGAIILDLCGAGLIATGSAMTYLAVTRTKKLDRFDRKYRQNSRNIALMPPGISINREGGGFTMGVLFL